MGEGANLLSPFPSDMEELGQPHGRAEALALQMGAGPLCSTCHAYIVGVWLLHGQRAGPDYLWPGRPLPWSQCHGGGCPNPHLLPALPPDLAHRHWQALKIPEDQSQIPPSRMASNTDGPIWVALCPALFGLSAWMHLQGPVLSLCRCLRKPMDQPLWSPYLWSKMPNTPVAPFCSAWAKPSCHGLGFMLHVLTPHACTALPPTPPHTSAGALD